MICHVFHFVGLDFSCNHGSCESPAAGYHSVIANTARLLISTTEWEIRAEEIK